MIQTGKNWTRLLVVGFLVFGGTVLLPTGSAVAGLSQPPVVLYGSLLTTRGDAILTGDLEFTFTPVLGGPPVVLKGELGTFGDGINLMIKPPVEKGPVSAPNKTLDLTSFYQVGATHNGQVLTSPDLPDQISPRTHPIVGPIRFVIEPTVPILVVSGNLEYGDVGGGFRDDVFVISNSGGGTLEGSAQLRSGDNFRIVEEGITVNVVPISLTAGASMEVTVRFQPIQFGTDFTDELQIRTNAGDEDRTVSGRNVEPPPTPTPTRTYTPAPTPTMNPRSDINADGVVDEKDFLIFQSQWRQGIRPTVPPTPTPTPRLTPTPTPT